MTRSVRVRCPWGVRLMRRGGILLFAGLFAAACGGTPEGERRDSAVVARADSSGSASDKYVAKVDEVAEQVKDRPGIEAHVGRSE